MDEITNECQKKCSDPLSPSFDPMLHKPYTIIELDNSNIPVDFVRIRLFYVLPIKMCFLHVNIDEDGI